MATLVPISDEQKRSAPWTIHDKLQAREDTRSGWEHAFYSSLETRADRISESIKDDFLGKLGQYLSNSYSPLPTSVRPFKQKYSFDLEKNTSAIKKWCQDTDDTPPFNEWIPAFEEKQKVKQQEKEMRRGHDDEESCCFVRVSNQSIETNYFQYLMAELGHRVEECVKRNLLAFAENPQNSSIRTEVKWYRKAEHLISNPSDFDDNLLYVSAWIEPANANLPSEQNLSAVKQNPEKKSWFWPFG